MTKYNILILKWSNLQLNKLKLKKKKKNRTEVTLN